MAKPVTQKNPSEFITGQKQVRRRQATPFLLSGPSGGVELKFDQDVLIGHTEDVAREGYLVKRWETTTLRISGSTWVWVYSDRNATLYWRTV